MVDNKDDKAEHKESDQQESEQKNQENQESAQQELPQHDADRNETNLDKDIEDLDQFLAQQEEVMPLDPEEDEELRPVFEPQPSLDKGNHFKGNKKKRKAGAISYIFYIGLLGLLGGGGYAAVVYTPHYIDTPSFEKISGYFSAVRQDAFQKIGQTTQNVIPSAPDIAPPQPLVPQPPIANFDIPQAADDSILVLDERPNPLNDAIDFVDDQAEEIEPVEASEDPILDDLPLADPIPETPSNIAEAVDMMQDMTAEIESETAIEDPLEGIDDPVTFADDAAYSVTELEGIDPAIEETIIADDMAVDALETLTISDGSAVEVDPSVTAIMEDTHNSSNSDVMDDLTAEAPVTETAVAEIPEGETAVIEEPALDTLVVETQSETMLQVDDMPAGIETPEIERTNHNQESFDPAPETVIIEKTPPRVSQKPAFKKKDPRVAQAKAFYDAGDYEQSFAIYEAILKDDPSNTNALTGRQLSLGKLRMNNIPVPLSTTATDQRVVVETDAQDQSDAVEPVAQGTETAGATESVQGQSTEVEFAVHMAEKLVQAGNKNEAIRWYQEALRLDVLYSTGLDRMRIYDAMADLMRE